MALAVSLIATAWLLVIGTIALRMMQMRLDGELRYEEYWLPKLHYAQLPSLLLILVSNLLTLRDAYRIFPTLLAAQYFALGFTLLATLEYINYYHRQRVHFREQYGSAFGPMVASENHVKGIAVYGAAARNWFEYLLDTLRYQGLVAGDSFENTDEKVRLGSRLMALVFLENMSVDEVKKSHPELVGLADAIFPNGLFNGKSLEFWRQLGQINFPAYWAKCDAHVLAIRGASDFVTYDVDHKLIADVVNSKHPDWGRSVVLPNSDHLFHNFATEQESMANFQKGEFNTAIATMLKEWIQEVRDSKQSDN